MKNELRVALTSGDADGIGPEVTAKALGKMGPQRGVRFYLWRSPVFAKKYLALIDRKFKRRSFSSWPEALRHNPSSSKELIEVVSTAPPARWVETSAEAGFARHIDAMVTAPLSKTSIIEAGLKDIGHTEILSRVSGEKDLFMAFLGRHFNVLLTTGHIPLQKVPAALTPALLEKSLRAAHLLGKLSSNRKKNKPPRLALLGLNPHAGESRLLGDQESTMYQPVLQRLRKDGLDVTDPLVPDAAFLPQNWKKYDVYVTPYHDQGLIPFKMAHAHKGGCHITMGLPFIRTSVEHGTAKDLFGKDKADSSSMQEAILRAILLSRNSFKPNDL